MDKSVESLASEALKLPPEDRVQLAERLLASVLANRDIDQVWSDEIERRVRAIESKNAPLITASDAIARARAAIQ